MGRDRDKESLVLLRNIDLQFMNVGGCKMRSEVARGQVYCLKEMIGRGGV